MRFYLTRTLVWKPRVKRTVSITQIWLHYNIRDYVLKKWNKGHSHNTIRSCSCLTPTPDNLYAAVVADFFDGCVGEAGRWKVKSKEFNAGLGLCLLYSLVRQRRGQGFEGFLHIHNATASCITLRGYNWMHIAHKP